MHLNEKKKNIKILLITSDTDSLSKKAQTLKSQNPGISLNITHYSDIIYPLIHMGYKDNTLSSDLIILDSNLRNSDIKMLLSYFQKNPAYNNTPLVLIVDSYEEKEKLTQMGIRPDCFIPQSFDINKLLHLIYSSGAFWLSVIRSQSAFSHRNDYSK